METINIRIDRAVHERLKKVAAKEHVSLREVINVLLDRYAQAEFRQAVAESYARLRSDPDTWADYKRELKEWDAVLMDGLKDEPPFDDANTINA